MVACAPLPYLVAIFNLCTNYITLQQDELLLLTILASKNSPKDTIFTSTVTSTGSPTKKETIPIVKKKSR
jgi:hypothetical protein